jgi:hypothetical protein
MGKTIHSHSAGHAASEGAPRHDITRGVALWHVYASLFYVHSSQADKNLTMKTLTECHSVIDGPIRLAPRVNNHDGDHDSGECGQPHSHPPGHTHACDQLLSGRPSVSGLCCLFGPKRLIPVSKIVVHAIIYARACSEREGLPASRCRQPGAQPAHRIGMGYCDIRCLVRGEMLVLVSWRGALSSLHHVA